MTTRHRLDPIHLYHAAERLGEVVADGDMSDADASAIIIAWAEATSGVDRSGLQARLHWAMRDRAADARRRKDNVTTAIRWAVRPLIQAQAAKAVVEEAAGQANGDTLPWSEVAAILRNEWDAIHGRRRRG